MNIIDSINLSIPKYETILPFSKQKVTFAPFRVKDAKALSLVMQEDNKKLALQNMVSLLKQCSENVDILDLCMADAEFLFLQIRSKSVDEVLNLIYNNKKIQVPIADIKARNDFTEQSIEIGNSIFLNLKTPTVGQILKLSSLEKEEMFKSYVDRITVRNEIYKLNKFVPDEIKNILDNLPLSVVPKIDKFIKNQPELYLSLTLENETKEVTGLLNFFTYR